MADPIRENVIHFTKAGVSAAATTRLKSFAWAKSLIEPVRQARSELSPLGGRKSDAAIARWLNEHGYRTVNGSTFDTKAAQRLMYGAADSMIEHAVLECRTVMSLEALSADFATADARVDSLEAEYLPIIADALNVGYQLASIPVPPFAALLVEAKERAVSVAHEQRSRKLVSMAAREGLWNPKNRVRLVFRSRDPEASEPQNA